MTLLRALDDEHRGRSTQSTVSCVSRIRRRENSSRRMRRRRVVGNELPRLPVIFSMTPAEHAGPCRAARTANALLSRPGYHEPEADLYMKDDVGGNVGRARFQALCQVAAPGPAALRILVIPRPGAGGRRGPGDACCAPGRRGIRSRAKRPPSPGSSPSSAASTPAPSSASGSRRSMSTSSLRARSRCWRRPRSGPRGAARRPVQAARGIPRAAGAAGAHGILDRRDRGASWVFRPAAVLTRLFRARKRLRVLCGEDTSMDPGTCEDPEP